MGWGEMEWGAISVRHPFIRSCKQCSLSNAMKFFYFFATICTAMQLPCKAIELQCNSAAIFRLVEGRIE